MHNIHIIIIVIIIIAIIIIQGCRFVNTKKKIKVFKTIFSKSGHDYALNKEKIQSGGWSEHAKMLKEYGIEISESAYFKINSEEEYIIKEEIKLLIF